MHRPTAMLAPVALAAALALTPAATAQTSDALSSHGRGVAILTPAESPDAPARHPKPLCLPYYSTVPVSARWAPKCYVPYYCGYCPDTKVPAGAAVPYGVAPVAADPAAVAPAGAGYGPFTGGPDDDKRLLRLGGTGPYQPSRPGVPDFIDTLHGLPHP